MPSITLIVPALNEEGNLEDTVKEIVPLLEKRFNDYEILIFNDGSSDKTGHIADTLSSLNDKIKVNHNEITRGLGYNYKTGVKMAQNDYVMMIPGDNDILKESMDEMFKRLGEKDMIIPYTGNAEIRPFSRRVLSRTFTQLMNLLFGLNLKYFNGVVIHKRPLIQSTPIETDSFAYQAEALIKLIKSGRTYLELPQLIRERRHGKSKALYPSNILKVLKIVFTLFCQIHFRKYAITGISEKT